MGLGSWVKRYKASSRQGLREGLGCRFVVYAGLGLEPAFRRGLGLGVGFEVSVKVSKSRSRRCSSTAPTPLRTRQPPPHPVPDHTIGGVGGGAGNARRLTIYTYIYMCMYVCMYVCMCICMHVYLYIYICMYVCMYVCYNELYYVALCHIFPHHEADFLEAPPQQTPENSFGQDPYPKLFSHEPRPLEP